MRLLLGVSEAELAGGNVTGTESHAQRWRNPAGLTVLGFSPGSGQIITNLLAT